MESLVHYHFYSDPHFKVSTLPGWRAKLYKFLSVSLWGQLPGNIQKRLSAVYASHYDKPYSKWIIGPYIRLNYRDKNYLDLFDPPGGKKEFESFQDFFIRRFKNLPRVPDASVWPCEGLLCDEGPVGSFGTVRVKNNSRDITTIFGLSPGDIPADYGFSNVFLHNKNYHRIHAPVSGTICRIQHIPGDLVVLRPWIYRQQPSLPAFRNERYNIDIMDDSGNKWFLSVIGGPAVGTIKLADHLTTGTVVEKLGEIAVFYLGSSCCLAAPTRPRYHFRHTFVEVGAPY